MHKVIAVTGNTGKTTVKEMIAYVLSGYESVFKSYKNGNDAFFMHKYKKEMQPVDFQRFILEFGMRKAGDIRRLCEIFTPNIAMITNLGYSHFSNFENIEAIAKAKSEIIYGMDPTGFFIYSADDPLSILLPLQDVKGHCVSIGLTPGCHYQAQSIKYTSTQVFFTIVFDGNKQDFVINLSGKHQVYNALFAIAACHLLGYDFAAIAKQLSTFKAINSRMNYQKHGNVHIIDDTYNANPEGMIAAIEFLSELDSPLRVAVLGPLMDHGKSTLGYTMVAQALINHNIDYLFTFNSKRNGDMAKHFGIESIKLGLSHSRTQHFNDHDSLAQYLVGFLCPEMALLFKGQESYWPLRTLWGCQRFRSIALLSALAEKIPILKSQ